MGSGYVGYYCEGDMCEADNDRVTGRELEEVFVGFIGED